MSDIADLATVASGLVSGFVLVLARLSIIVFMMPGLGEQVIPTRVRIAVLLAMSLLISSAAAPALPRFNTLTSLLEAIILEVAIGFVLGGVLRLAIWMLTIAGTVIAQSIGLSQFLGVALETEQQTLFANLLALAGAALLFAVDFHVHVLVSLIALYETVPVTNWPELEILSAAQMIISAFGHAIALAWPFVIGGLVYNICLGFINRALPQLMVAFVGAPFIVGAGVVFLAMAAVSLLLAWKDTALQLIGFV